MHGMFISAFLVQKRENKSKREKGERASCTALSYRSLARSFVRSLILALSLSLSLSLLKRGECTFHSRERPTQRASVATRAAPKIKRRQPRAPKDTARRSSLHSNRQRRRRQLLSPRVVVFMVVGSRRLAFAHGISVWVAEYRVYGYKGFFYRF